MFSVASLFKLGKRGKALRFLGVGFENSYETIINDGSQFMTIRNIAIILNAMTDHIR